MTSSKKGMVGLAIGAIGIVFGDIGTSPLYALQVLFSPLGQHLDVTRTNVYGIISLIAWAVTLIVSVKYIGFIMRANNGGEGGIVALVALVKSSRLNHHAKSIFILLGLLGVALFYGDSVITPAISVLSAVEGLKVVEPSLTHVIVPVTLVILTGLFWVQRFGTGFIGKLFGPVMVLWFTAIAAGGAWRVSQHPDILRALSPIAAIQFFTAHPLVAFLSMGAVTLAVTGAEALYADMGHFGRPPIARAWFFLVFPALLLCYMGQAALIINNPETIHSPLVLLFPESLRFSIVILATFATLIASQSVISGAFSLTRQAIHLNFLPKMRVLHTSARTIGQVYLPFINFLLFVGVAFLVVTFGSSEKLANAFGLAVSGTLAVDTILFLVVMYAVWRKNLSLIVATGIVFLSVDLLLFSSNVPKMAHGGWFPALIALLVFTLISTWRTGQTIVSHERKSQEGTLQDFVNTVDLRKPQVARVPGTAVYISHHQGYTPLALHSTINELHELHEKVIIVSVDTSNSPHVPEKQRAVYDGLIHDDGISHISLTYGFHDSINIPKTLKTVVGKTSELDFDPEEVSYFVSLAKIVPTNRPNMAHWRKTLYSIMAHNAVSSSDYYKLPTNKTAEIHSLIEL